MKLSEGEISSLEERSRKLRIEIFDLSRKRGGYHFGGALSSADILVCLYKKILQPKDEFILSKGHSAFALYPLLIEQGYNPTISGHPDMDIENGIACTTGSLGMGYPTAIGKALSKKIKNEQGTIYVLMGETELQEGTGWESLLIATHHKLDNLVCIVDHNKNQGSGCVDEILSFGDIEKKLRSFGAEVFRINGHSHQEIIDKLSIPTPERCKFIIADTIKGKGAKVMEKNPGKWHAKFPSPEQLKQVYNDLGSELTDIKCEVEFKKSLDMRKAFGEALYEIAQEDDRLVLIAGDYESGVDLFKENYPERYFNLGTTEQSTISIAAGMAIEGFRPFVYSVTPFILERPFEQVKICIDQQNLPVILVGFDDYPEHGPTHAALNPEKTIELFNNFSSFFPKTYNEARQSIIEAYGLNKPAFVRLVRDYC